MTAAEILQRTRAYVLENFLYMRRDPKLDHDDPLLATGVIDSLGVMELVGFVEQTFQVQVDPADITEEHFGTLNAIARYVAAKQASSRAA